MASPHIAGLAAYLLGTDWASSVALTEALEARNAASTTPGAFVQSFAQFAFGKKSQKVLIKPEDHVLSPKALKKAMLSIATKGALTDVAGSPNLLSFNKYVSLPPLPFFPFDLTDPSPYLQLHLLLQVVLDHLQDR